MNTQLPSCPFPQVTYPDKPFYYYFYIFMKIELSGVSSPTSGVPTSGEHGKIDHVLSVMPQGELIFWSPFIKVVTLNLKLGILAD